MKKLILALICLLSAIPCAARIITVDDDGPADFDNIQAAINDANDGDVVEVQPGFYTGTGNRDIDFLGKAITVRSTDPNDPSVVAETVIYCQGAGRGFTFYSGEGHNSVVAGLTIANGYANTGGGVYCLESSPTISYCTIIYNSSDWGGGISCTASDAIITHCIITNNTAEWGGGGIECASAGRPKIKHCTIAYNWTGIGNEVSPVGGGGINMNQCSLVVTNCILWGNTTESGKGPQIAVWGPGIPRLGISYCNVQGGREDVFGSALNWDIGNIDVAPLFQNSASRDYHLKSQAGRWEPFVQTWIQDDVTSPCIDAGNPGCPLGDEPDDANNVRINMGAYGGTAQASKSPANWRSIADLTNDWVVDFIDLAVFVNYWLDSGWCIPSDLNRNQTVDFTDFAIFGKHLSGGYFGEPGIIYEISKCGMGLLEMAESGQTRFTVTVDGSYIHFEDVMVANCCADELWLDMDVTDNLITIYEREYGLFPCYCICDSPVTAALGPFAPGIYTLEVYEDFGGFIGSATVIIQ